MPINLTAKVAEKTVDRFKLKSVTEGLFTADYSFISAATVRVHTIDNLTLGDYDDDAATGSRFGNYEDVGDTYQDMTLSQNKSFNGVLDKSNTSKQNFMKAAGQVLKQNVDEVIIPTLDKYRLTKLAAGAGNSLTGYTAAKSTIVEEIMLANAEMTNDLVPLDGRVLYIGASAAIKCKIADQVVGLEKMGSEAIVNGVIGWIDGAQVRVVPDSYMPTGVVFMIVKRGCAVAPKTVDLCRVIDSENVDGKLLQCHLIHDCFVLTTKADGICKVTS